MPYVAHEKYVPTSESKTYEHQGVHQQRIGTDNGRRRRARRFRLPSGDEAVIAMFHELLLDWGEYDTWIVITAALAAAACALPGNYLLLRRQSLLGDALSHSVLPGIVLSYLAWNALEQTGWLPIAETAGLRHLVLFIGAAGSGLLAAVLWEWTHRLGRLDAGSALGVVACVRITSSSSSGAAPLAPGATATGPCGRRG